MISRILLWIVFDGPCIGPLAPWLMGIALGSWPVKQEKKK